MCVVCVCVRIYLKCTNEWMYMDIYMHCTCEYARIRMYLTYTQGLSTTLLLPQATLKPNFFRPEESKQNYMLSTSPKTFLILAFEFK